MSTEHLHQIPYTTMLPQQELPSSLCQAGYKNVHCDILHWVQQIRLRICFVRSGFIPSDYSLPRRQPNLTGHWELLPLCRADWMGLCLPSALCSVGNSILLFLLPVKKEAASCGKILLWLSELYHPQRDRSPRGPHRPQNDEHFCKALPLLI